MSLSCARLNLEQILFLYKHSKDVVPRVSYEMRIKPEIRGRMSIFLLQSFAQQNA
jgi:hypothetical protein